MASRFRATVFTAQPCNIRIGFLHLLQECDEYVAAQWCTFLVAGLCAPLRSAFVTTPDLVDFSRCTPALAPVRWSPARCANVVSVGCIFERLAESRGGCRFVASGPARAGLSVPLSSRFLGLSAP